MHSYNLHSQNRPSTVRCFLLSTGVAVTRIQRGVISVGCSFEGSFYFGESVGKHTRLYAQEILATLMFVLTKYPMKYLSLSLFSFFRF